MRSTKLLYKSYFESTGVFYNVVKVNPPVPSVFDLKEDIHPSCRVSSLSNGRSGAAFLSTNVSARPVLAFDA